MGESSNVRSEIQALRTAAVLAVVLYHLWPNRLPGGFVGVDIFFAISGFLITAHLVREVEQDGSIRVSRFWVRRIRRLLPASMLVLACTILVVFIVIPRSLWNQFLTAILAAIGYSENWLLANQAVDYLAANNVATPVQHFWSLGVEEQFYVAWPLLLVLALACAKRSRSYKADRVILGVLSAIFIVSLMLSIVYSATSPSIAYFGTHIRAWEFAAGGIVAIVAPDVISTPPAVRTAISWMGWTGIAASFLVFTGDTPFPSATALLPVVSTLAVIVAGSPNGSWGTGPFMDFKPVQLIGNWSYSIYLWHWPIVVILPYAMNHPLGTRSKLAILLSSVILAAVTKRFVEDPMRGAGRRRRKSPRTRVVFGTAVIAMIAVASAPVVGIRYTNSVEAASAAAASARATDTDECFGAPAMLHPSCEPVPATDVLPAPAAVFNDTQKAFDCYRQEGQPELHRCTFGSTRKDALRIALTGDSHGAMLVPGLRDRMKALNWRLDVYVGWGGYWRDPSTATGTDGVYLSRLNSAIDNGNYDVVLTTAHRDPTGALASNPSEQEGMRTVWKRAEEMGTRVIAIRDNPQITTDALGCVTNANASTTSFERCAVPARSGLGGVDNVAAAARSAGISLIDTSRFFCAKERCPVVIGGVVVYRDEHHITATYSSTLAPWLIRAIKHEIRPASEGS